MQLVYYLTGIYLFKVNNGTTRKMCEISSKLTEIVIVIVLVPFFSFEQVSHIVLVFPLLSLNK